MSDEGNRLIRTSVPSPHGETQSEARGDTSCDVLRNTIKSTCDPFKEALSSKGTTLHHIGEAVNALSGLQSAPAQLLNTGIARIPLLDKMPGMPAATIGAAHLGTPHAHDHPPSDGFPLPSMGATIGSGCLSVLIGGVPAARVTDIGIAPTCGGLTPFFNIQTGSSNTFIGGMRAARMGIDMTRHCNPMGHAGKSGEEAEGVAKEGEEAASEAAEVTSRARWMGRAGKAWKVGNAALGPASGVAGAASDAKHHEILAAAMTAAQTAADAAMMVLSNLMGKDPGIEPSMGMLMDGNPTVLIGGFPLPDSQVMWHGATRGLGKKVRSKLPKWAQELACEFWGEPVSAVTGEVKNDFTDYETDEAVPFMWRRHYCSGWNERDGALGYGFRHGWQYELHLLRTRAVYVNPRGGAYTFSRGEDGRYGGYCQGYILEQLDGRRFVVCHDTEGDAEFERVSDMDRSPCCCIGFVRDGERSSLRWNASGCLTKIEQADEYGHVRRMVDFGYDPCGRIVEVVLTSIDGRRMPIARYGYDGLGRLVAYRNALDATSVSEYDEHRRVVRLTDANGYSFFYRYDGEGRCVDSHGQDGMWHVRFEYRPGRTTVTEADGGRWTVLYNETGTITRVVDPYGGATEYVIDEGGRISEEIDSGGRVLTWLYDARERNTGRVDRWGNVWPVKDEAPNLPDPSTLNVPDTPLALQWGEVKSGSLSRSMLLPPEIAGLVETIVAHDAPSVNARVEQRDAAGRIVASTDEYGSTERQQHDAAGNLLLHRDRDGRDYYYSRMSWNLPESETDPLGNTVRYRFTAKREIAAIIDGNGNESAYTYDLKNRITSVRRNGVLRETYTYDAGDRLVEKRDGAGNILLRCEVGDDGLRSKRMLASGEVHSYTYDQRGHCAKASTDKFDVTMVHDALGHRIADKRDGAGVEHAYAGGRLVRTTYLERVIVRYDAIGDDEVLIDASVGGTHRLQRTSDGRILLRLGNGTNILCTFDGYGRCTGRLVWPESRLEELRCVRYQYSATGELRRVIDHAEGTTEYQYDAAHRLTGETRDGWPVRRYEYDRGGNLLSTPACQSMRYADGNRLASASIGAFRYNHRNHLAEEIRENNYRIAYHYDDADLLVGVTWSDRDEVWRAEYDALSRRVTKAMGDARTRYYWDGHRLAAEVGADGRLRIYVYVNEDAFLPFMFVDYADTGASPETGQAYFVFCNQVGLPEWIENRNREIVWRAKDIDPYGAVQVADGNAVEYDLRWPGHWLERETGLHCNRFRSYSPLLGRYIQTDPMGQAGGFNLYAYPENPLVLTDVLGLFPARKNRPGKSGVGHDATANRSNQSKGAEADREASSAGTAATRKQPEFAEDDVDWVHVLGGKFNDEGKFVGGHHADSIKPDKGIKVNVTKRSHELGKPYRADLVKNGAVIHAGKDMFPESWKDYEVKADVLAGLNDDSKMKIGKTVPPNQKDKNPDMREFETVTPRGMIIKGFIDVKAKQKKVIKIPTLHPVFE